MHTATLLKSVVVSISSCRLGNLDISLTLCLSSGECECRYERLQFTILRSFFVAQLKPEAVWGFDPMASGNQGRRLRPRPAKPAGSDSSYCHARRIIHVSIHTIVTGLLAPLLRRIHGSETTIQLDG
eukprot:scaffold93373_cov31-Prasinocladus_malaysianus.AAC.1